MSLFLTANRWQVVIDNPMARGAEPLTFMALFSSAAAAKTTNTRTKVINISIPKPCPIVIPAFSFINVAPGTGLPAGVND